MNGIKLSFLVNSWFSAEKKSQRIYLKVSKTDKRV